GGGGRTPTRRDREEAAVEIRRENPSDRPLRAQGPSIPEKRSCAGMEALRQHQDVGDGRSQYRIRERPRLIQVEAERLLEHQGLPGPGGPSGEMRLNVRRDRKVDRLAQL